MKYYVYALVDPRTDAPFYIGKGQGNRIDHHELEAKKGLISKKCAQIRDIWGHGLSVIKVKLAEFSDEAEAYRNEKQRIASFGASNLTNAAGGGGRSRLPKLDERDALDVLALGSFAKFKRKSKYFSQTSLFYKLYRDAAHDVREVIARRGLDWVNSYSSRTRLIIENSR